MRRHFFAAVLVLGLIAIVAGAASADPWPSWGAVTGDFGLSVSSTQTSQGYDYTVQVDPSNKYPGWGIKAFVVYVEGVTTQYSQGSNAYNGGNTAGWTNTNGGWELNKYPGPTGTTAAFGWLTGSDYLMSGSSAVFHAILPAGFENYTQHFVVHAAPPDGGNTFWTNGGEDWEDPDIRTPEPGSLALLALGLGAVTGVIRKRRSS